MSIHIPTLALVLCLLVLLQTAGTCLFLHRVRDVPGNWHFLYGSLLLVLATVFLLLRFWFESSKALVLLSNITLLAAITALYVGVIRFAGRRVHAGLVASTGVLFILGMVYFTYAYDHMNIRVALYSAALCVLTGNAGRELLFLKRTTYIRSLKAVGIFSIFCFAASAVRIAVALAGPPMRSILESTVSQVFTFLAAIAGCVIWTFMIALSFHERVGIEKREAQERLKTIYEAIPEMVILTEYDTGVVVEANRRFYRKLGLHEEAVVGKKTTEIGFWNGEEERLRFLDILRRRGKVDNHEILVRRKDGTTFTGLLSSRPLELGGVKHIISVFRDIDERKRMENELEKQAQTDALTGVFNRRHFLRSVRREISHSQETGGRLVFMMLDIDHFKRINDYYGHQLGDTVIRLVSQSIRSELRASDLLGRIGGEEFAILLVNTDPAAGERIGESIRRKVENLEVYADATTPVYITVSIGLAEYRPDKDDTIDTLIARADEALYKAKAAGRNSVVSLW
jgi:diguanylate cyclase (GGDEF)-like protein/PAS domain S-box-containing protein